MTIYVVEKVDKCKKCEGSGYVQNALWKECFDYFGELGFTTATDEEIAQWWWDQGYYKIPPEEDVCPECEGEGEVVSRIDLREALADLTGTGHETGTAKHA